MSSNTVRNGSSSNERQSSFFAAGEGNAVPDSIRAGAARSLNALPRTNRAEARPRPTSSLRSARPPSVRPTFRSALSKMCAAAWRNARPGKRPSAANAKNSNCFSPETERTPAPPPSPAPPANKLIEFPRTATLLDPELEIAVPERTVEHWPSDDRARAERGSADTGSEQLTIFEETRSAAPGIWHFRPVRPACSALRLDDPAELNPVSERELRPEAQFELPLKVAPFRLRGFAAGLTWARRLLRIPLRRHLLRHPPSASAGQICVHLRPARRLDALGDLSIRLSCLYRHHPGAANDAIGDLRF